MSPVHYQLLHILSQFAPDLQAPLQVRQLHEMEHDARMVKACCAQDSVLHSHAVCCFVWSGEKEITRQNIIAACTVVE